jgi:thymidine phosphorylase
MMEVEDVLSGNGPKDLIEVCIALASSMMMLSDQRGGMVYEQAKEVCLQKLSSGEAKNAFSRFVQEQGGKLNSRGGLVYTDRPVECKTIFAQEEGFLQEVYASSIGRASMLLGAGRKIRTDQIDPGAGIVLHKKIGDRIKKGDKLCTLHIGSRSKIVQTFIEEAATMSESAFVYSSHPVSTPTEVIRILS